MKLFINNIFEFLVISLMILIILSVTTFTIVDNNTSFKLDVRDSILIFGHSHPQTAFNDSLLNGVRNLSKSMEPYYYTYHKVRKILEQNNQVKIIFIEYTNNQISQLMNKWIWGNKNITNLFPKYAPFLGIEDNLLLISHNFSGYLNGLSLALKEQISNILKHDYNLATEMSGYWYLKMNKVDSLLSVKRALRYNINIVSEYNISYLSKIIELCKEKDMKIYLIRSPLHPEYKGYLNEKLFKSIRNNKFHDIDFLDFSKFPLQNDKYGDLGHLNYKGAKIFTLWFKSILENGFLEVEDKQTFINERLPNIKL